MSGVPPERAVEMPDGDPQAWPLLVGLVLPLALILGSAILLADAKGQLLGISLANWCLFACAPITSVCLTVCYRFGTSASERNDTAAGSDPR